jgi:hypothetical protein
MSLRGAVFIIGLTVLLAACRSTRYGIEQIDGDHTVPLPFTLNGFSGIRDGAMVQADARFVDHDDFIRIHMSLFLRPPAEFESGAYTASVGGKETSGSVDCPSLDFQGGQTALPVVGGVFILKDAQNRPIYRVRIPATQLAPQKSRRESEP